MKTQGKIESFLANQLEEREKNDLLRTLPDLRNGIDFCSNDYLGFSKVSFSSAVNSSFGSTGSRLITGNYPEIVQLEKKIADYHSCEAALIFNSGYAANVGLIAAVAKRGDTILYDELCHASIRDGVRLSSAKTFSFRHNDLSDLIKKSENAEGNVFVVVESVYSMDGDCAPLEELVVWCKANEAGLIVDEAHAIGVFGTGGEGLVQEKNLQTDVFARVVTFGKALGSHGAAVLGSALLKKYLVNFARTFIYTTALPPVVIEHISNAYDSMRSADQKRTLLFNRVDDFQLFLSSLKITSYSQRTPIQSVVIPGNTNAKKVALELQSKNLMVKAILSPTVPAGAERLRICLHSFNTNEELTILKAALKKNIHA